MRKLILPILLLHLTVAVNAATYYFSSSQGDDSRTAQEAQSSSSPWKTIGKLNSIMSILRPGDEVLFKRGESYYGGINVTVSGADKNPITFGAYGSGFKPIITGFMKLEGWSQVRNNVWEADFSVPNAGTANVVTVNNQLQAQGRYPNSDATDGGYLNIDSHVGLYQITSHQLTGYPDWTGGEIVVRKNRWVIDRSRISYYVGNTIGFDIASQNQIYDNYGFFIQNHTSTLDEDGEWFYDKSRGKLQMYFSNNDPNSYSVKASNVETLPTSRFSVISILTTLHSQGANSYRSQPDQFQQYYQSTIVYSLFWYQCSTGTKLRLFYTQQFQNQQYQQQWYLSILEL